MEALVIRTTIVVATLLASVACTKKVMETTISPTAGSATSAQLAKPLDGPAGADSARGAVRLFLAGVRAQDLRGMSAVWGDNKKPYAEMLKREELEKRLIVIQCLLGHDKWQFAEERARLVTGGRQEYLINLQQKTLKGTTKFTVVANSSGRWFVEDIDLAQLKDFCR